MRVIIPCAGRGTRMIGTWSDGTHIGIDMPPKCLLEVGGKPILAHILEYVNQIYGVNEVRIVHRPDDGEVILDAVIAMRKRIRLSPIYFMEQPEPLGEGDAVWHALENVKSSKEPVLIILGDTVPKPVMLDPAVAYKMMQPDKSIIGIKEHLRRNPSNGTALFMKKDWYVYRFAELRNGKRLDGDWFLRGGIDFIRRGDYLFDALDIYKRYKVTNAGEYRLTQAYQYMWHHGESFEIAQIPHWHCGTPAGLQNMKENYEDFTDR